MQKLSEVLGIDHETLESQMMGWPDRGRSLDMPPKEPLIYRLYEIVQNYGYAYKAVLNEKFGDGIMSAISFSTHVEKETDEKGDWVKITMRGKWWVLSSSSWMSPYSLMLNAAGCPLPDSRWSPQWLSCRPFSKLSSRILGHLPRTQHRSCPKTCSVHALL